MQKSLQQLAHLYLELVRESIVPVFLVDFTPEGNINWHP